MTHAKLAKVISNTLAYSTFNKPAFKIARELLGCIDDARFDSVEAAVLAGLDRCESLRRRRGKAILNDEATAVIASFVGKALAA